MKELLLILRFENGAGKEFVSMNHAVRENMFCENMLLLGFEFMDLKLVEIRIHTMRPIGLKFTSL